MCTEIKWDNPWFVDFMVDPNGGLEVWHRFHGDSASYILHRSKRERAGLELSRIERGHNNPMATAALHAIESILDEGRVAKKIADEADGFYEDPITRLEAYARDITVQTCIKGQIEIGEISTN